VEKNAMVVGLTSSGKTISIMQEYEEMLALIKSRSTWQGV
jgi:hypothetical protein